MHTVFGVSQDHRRRDLRLTTLSKRLPAVALLTTGVVHAKRDLAPSYFGEQRPFNGVFQLTKRLGLAYNQSISSLPRAGCLDTPNDACLKRGRSRDYGLRS